MHDGVVYAELAGKALTLEQVSSNNSARMDSIMIGVETLMGAKDGQEGELQLAAKSLRELADDGNSNGV